MNISILRHNCRIWQFVAKSNDVCPFYYKWAHAYFITLWGIRIVIGKPRSDNDQEKLQKWIKLQSLESGSGKQ